MSEYTGTGHELGWDDSIENEEGQYILLEGDHNFTVTNFERGRFPGSAKIPACNKAILTLSVQTPEGTASVKYDLILFSTLEWKLCDFFRAIGQKKHGEKLVMNWSAVMGSKGRAKFKPRDFTKKDGTAGKANDLESFYDYDPAFFQTAAPDWTKAADAAPEEPAQTAMPDFQAPARAFTPGQF